MIVEKVMTKKVITLKSDYSMFKAAQVLYDNAISGAPVINDKKKIVGIIRFYNTVGVLGHMLQKRAVNHCVIFGKLFKAVNLFLRFVRKKYIVIIKKAQIKSL